MSKKIQIDIDVNSKSGEQSIGKLNNEINKAHSTIKGLEAEQERLNEKLKGVEIGSKEYNKLSKELSNVNSKLKNTELAFEGLDMEQRASETGSLISGFTDMATAAGALSTQLGFAGGSADQLTANIATGLSVAMAFKGGVEGVISAQKLLKNVTTESAIAQKVLNVAMEANPIGVVILAITALIGAFAAYSAIANDTAEQQEALSDSMDESQKSLEGVYKGVNKVSNAFDEADKGTKSRKEALDIYNKTLGKSMGKMTDYNEAEKHFRDNTDNYIKAAQLRAQADALSGIIAKKQAELYVEKGKDINDRVGFFKKGWIALKAAVSGNVFEGYAKGLADAAHKQANDEAEVIKDLQEQAQKMLKQSDDIITGMGGDTEETNDNLKSVQKTVTNLSSLFDTMRDNAINNLKDATEQQIANIRVNYADKIDKIFSETERKKLDSLKTGFVQGKITTAQYYAQRADLLNTFYNNASLQRRKLYDDYVSQKDDEITKVKELNEAEKNQLNNSTKILKNKLEIEKTKSNGGKKEDLNALYEKEKELELKQAELNKQSELDKARTAEKKANITAQYKQKEYDITVKYDKLIEDEETKANDESTNKLKNTSKEKEDILNNLSKNLSNALAAAFTSDDFNAINGAFEQLTTNISSQFQSLFQAIKDGGKDSGEAIAQMSIGIANNFAGAIGSIMSQQANAQEKRISESFNANTNSLKVQLANREISQKEYDNKIMNLKHKRYQEEINLKRKQFKQEKAMAIVKATITGAQAALAAYASGNAYPFVGPATGAIFAAIAGAFTAAEIGIIASKKFHAATGGIVPGTPNGNKDTVPSMLSPGEAVINAESTAAYAPLLSAINEAGGGKKLSNATINNDSKNYKTQIVRAYVVEQDITKSQKTANKIHNISQF